MTRKVSGDIIYKGSDRALRLMSHVSSELAAHM